MWHRLPKDALYWSVLTAEHTVTLKPYLITACARDFSPHNTSTRLQPFDARVIASVKKCFANLKIQKAVDLIDSDATENIYDCDLRPAILFIYHIC